MPRFVILRHETPEHYPRGLHWDLMLETSGSLRTWALPEEPRPGTRLPAEALANHRLAYLEFEGEVAHNRGAVSRFDAGTYTVQRCTENRWEIQLWGEQLRGDAVLQRDSADERSWTLVLS